MAVKPTRMGLLITKKKLKLAQKGHKLLKEKRDSLVLEFFQVLRDIRDLRKNLGKDIVIADSALKTAQAVQGIAEIDRLTKAVSEDLQIAFSEKSIMGVKIPVIEEIEAKNDWYGYTDSSAELDNAVVLYRKLFPTLVRLAQKQLALNRLADDIKKTKRKVNALEYIIIPRLEHTRDEIAFKLSEQERENFSRLKMIKKKL